MVLLEALLVRSEEIGRKWGNSAVLGFYVVEFGSSYVADGSRHWLTVNRSMNKHLTGTVAYPGILFRGGGVQQIQLRKEDRENGYLGAVAP